jgi:hypothetical protein
MKNRRRENAKEENKKGKEERHKRGIAVKRKA